MINVETGQKTVLEVLLDRLDGINEFDINQAFADSEPPAAGEKVIADIPDKLRYYWALLCKIKGEMKSFLGTIRLSDVVDGLGSSRKAEIEMKLSQLHLQHEILSKCFWHECRKLDPQLASAPCIGVRKGWKIVTCSGGDIPEVLKSFFGL